MPFKLIMSWQATDVVVLLEWWAIIPSLDNRKGKHPVDMNYFETIVNRCGGVRVKKIATRAVLLLIGWNC